MATELREKLNAILTEKNEKILPENIKTGITVLGVNGSYDTGEFVGTTIYDTCLSMSEDILDIPGWVTNKVFKAAEVKASYSDSYNNAANTSNKCQVDGSNAWKYRSYLLYNLDELLAKKDKIIFKSAKLHFHIFYGNDYYRESISYLGKIGADWTESGTDWTNQPPIADYVEGSPLTPSWSLDMDIPCDYSVDVTEIVRDWLDGETNYGIGIRAVTEGGFRHNWQFYNRRYNSGAKATYIEIIYDEYEM